MNEDDIGHLLGHPMSDDDIDNLLGHPIVFGPADPSTSGQWTYGVLGHEYPVYDNGAIEYDVGYWEDKPAGADTYFVEVNRPTFKSESTASQLALAVLRGGNVAPLIDALLEAGHEPDGDEPVTDEWLEEEFGFLVSMFSVSADDGRHIFTKSSGEYRVWHLIVRTRRDARAVIRMRGYTNA